MSEDLTQGVRWSRVNDEPFEYAIQIGPHGDEFVKLLNGDRLRRPAEEIERLRAAKAAALKLADERAIEAVELRAMLASANERVAEMQHEAGMYHSLYDVSQAKLAIARNALEPFAAIDFPEVYSDRLPILGIDRLIGGLTLEHLRAAKAALTDDLRDSGAPTASREPMQTNATQPTGSQTSSVASAYRKDFE